MKPLTRKNLSALLGCPLADMPTVITLTRDGVSVGRLEAPAARGPNARYRLAGDAPETANGYHAHLPTGTATGPWSN